MENEWPSVIECAQYKMGLIQRYFRKLDWEDMNLSDSKQFDDPAKMMPSAPFLRKLPVNLEHNTVGMAKRFLHQVRTSRGYDVDCIPPPSFESPFTVIDLDRLPEACSHAEHLREVKRLVIDYIEQKTGKRHEFVKFLKVIWTTASSHLLTFTAREVGSSGDPQTFVATVAMNLNSFGKVVGKVRECMLKPQGPAPTDGLMSSTCCC